MAYDLLTPQGIDSFINDYRASEAKKQVDPLTTKKKRTDDLNTAYSDILSRLSDLKNISNTLQLTGNSSAFLVKKATSSNSQFVDISATSAAPISSQSIRVNQLAKSDIAISQDLNSSAASTTITVPGTHNIVFTSGDGNGGTLTSHVAVTFNASDFTAGTISNANVISKIQSAINSNQAVVTSKTVTGSTVSAGSFNLNLNGTITTINYTAGTYSAVMDNIVTQVNKIYGIQAAKIDNGGGNFSLQFTVTDSSKYLTINGDTSGLVTELGIAVTEEMGASGMLTASSFSPDSTLTQLSIATKKTGYDYRLLSLSDAVGSNALASVGMNLGGTRPTFVQNLTGADTPGFVYATSALNSKIEFNGIVVSRNSNQISDLIPGATISLKSLMQPTDSTVNLDISNDTDSIVSRIQDFIEKYNKAYTYLKEKTKSTKDERGLLIGDSIAESFKYLLPSLANNTVAGINKDNINTLSRLGLTFDITDGLKIADQTQLKNNVKSKPDQVAALFNSTNGIAITLYARINPYVNSNGYIFAQKKNLGINSQYYDDRIKKVQDRIEKNASDLRLRYMKAMSASNSMVSNQQIFFMKSIY